MDKRVDKQECDELRIGHSILRRLFFCDGKTDQNLRRVLSNVIGEYIRRVGFLSKLHIHLLRLSFRNEH
ncbi:MAG: hypothetical protein ABA06_00775 [Parcubacteria bacterium C7867-001]|nr:MAG: hypothetical protein ABA06_00775 [Parcubacteria bacterium C7867-001]